VSAEASAAQAAVIPLDKDLVPELAVGANTPSRTSPPRPTRQSPAVRARPSARPAPAPILNNQAATVKTTSAVTTLSTGSRPSSAAQRRAFYEQELRAKKRHHFQHYGPCAISELHRLGDWTAEQYMVNSPEGNGDATSHQRSRPGSPKRRPPRPGSAPSDSSRAPPHYPPPSLPSTKEVSPRPDLDSPGAQIHAGDALWPTAMASNVIRQQVFSHRYAQNARLQQIHSIYGQYLGQRCATPAAPHALGAQQMHRPLAGGFGPILVGDFFPMPMPMPSPPPPPGMRPAPRGRPISAPVRRVAPTMRPKLEESSVLAEASKVMSDVLFSDM